MAANQRDAWSQQRLNLVRMRILEHSSPCGEDFAQRVSIGPSSYPDQASCQSVSGANRCRLRCSAFTLTGAAATRNFASEWSRFPNRGAPAEPAGSRPLRTDHTGRRARSVKGFLGPSNHIRDRLALL